MIDNVTKNMLKFSRYFSSKWPDDIIIEPTNFCNLACPVCPTFLDMRRPKGYMSYEVFKSIIDDICGKIPKISMNFAGEPLLNKNVFRMVKYAKNANIQSLISTNGMLINCKVEQLLDSGLHRLIVGLDGTTPDIHERYRRRSSFYRILKGIESLCNEKAARNISEPHINLQFVVMAQNENQIDDIIALSEKIGVDSLSLKTMSLGSMPKTPDELLSLAEIWLPLDNLYSRYKISNGKVELKMKPNCCTLYQSAVIFWNGDVGICCYDFSGDYTFGNVIQDGGFSKIYKSIKWKYVQFNMQHRKFDICNRCNLTNFQGRYIIFNDKY